MASPIDAPAPPQLETTPTTPAPSLDKAVAAADLAASSSRPATWEEHVSDPLLSLCNLLFSVSLCRALQPFGHALVEAGKAFFGMEQEKSALRGLLEYEAGKCLD